MTLQLQVSGVSLSVGGEPTLREISFRMPPGSVGGIAGPQGAGKSTLLRLLAGLLTGADGQALLGDVDLLHNPGWARRRAGYVTEQQGFYEEMGVSEYLIFMAGCHRLPAANRVALVHDLLEVVDLSRIAGARIETLSSGMRRRLAVARALLHDPDLLLLDEPFAGLDARSRHDMGNLLAELRAMDKCVLLCTAELESITEVATHIGILSGGKMAAFGTRDEILGGGRQGRMLEIRVGGDAERVAETLRSMPQVTAVTAEGSLLTVTYSGGDGAIQSLLATLVRSGSPVLEFTQVRGGLQGVLRELTEGWV